MPKPNHWVCFGQKDDSSDQNSQMCLLIPNEGGQRPVSIDSRNPRIQVVKVGNIAYVNLHLRAPRRNTTPEQDPDLGQLARMRDRLIREEGCDYVHIMGDWNRKKTDLLQEWRENLNTPSPGEQSHLPPHRFAGSVPNPIDHHILWRASTLA